MSSLRRCVVLVSVLTLLALLSAGCTVGDPLDGSDADETAAAGQDGEGSEADDAGAPDGDGADADAPGTDDPDDAGDPGNGDGEAPGPPPSSPTPAPGESAPPSSPDCRPEDAAEMDTAIGGQLEDFVAGDFEGALEWATPSFRASFPPEEFEAMIRSRFPIPASATSHRQLACQGDDSQAVVLVDVSSPAGSQQLTYLLRVVDGAGWRIDGATPVTGATTPPQTA